MRIDQQLGAAKPAREFYVGMSDAKNEQHNPRQPDRRGHGLPSKVRRSRLPGNIDGTRREWLRQRLFTDHPLPSRPIIDNVRRFRSSRAIADQIENTPPALRRPRHQQPRRHQQTP